MREQLTQYVNLLFAGTPENEDMKQEILQNTLDRYDDLIEQGKTPEAAYRLAIAGIGDINELLGSRETIPEPIPERTDYRGRPLPSPKKKLMRSIAIALYICCPVPIIALSNVGNSTIGVCLMFLLIAVATVLIIMSSSAGKSENEQKADEPQTELGKALKSAWGIITLGIYLGISFWSGAWYITWLIFPIMGALQGLIKAILDLKEANKNEA